MQGLIKWLNMTTEDATWEDKSFISAQFPGFSHSWGQVCANGGGIVTYRRKKYKDKSSKDVGGKSSC